MSEVLDAKLFQDTAAGIVLLMVALMLSLLLDAALARVIKPRRLAVMSNE
jgi:hypothetical protein